MMIKKWNDFIIENKSMNKELYHYTSLDNAIKILKSDKLKKKPMSIQNKYSKLDMDINDYGYVSFTENSEFEDLGVDDISTDIRFIFIKNKLEKIFKLIPYSYDDEKYSSIEQEYGDISDNDEWFGDESEIRIYDDISLEYLDSIQLIEGDDMSKEKIIQNLCSRKNYKYIQYD